MIDGQIRGQSEVLGVIFSFVIVIGLIGINQVFIVPQTNKEVEIQHDEAVQGDMVNLRSEAIEAAASNNPQTASVKLGVEYPTRFVARNPPPVSGTLQTVDGGKISIENVRLAEICGTDNQPDTRFWRYEADYNVYSSGLPITIENTVAHRGSGVVNLPDTKQTVIKGNVIRIVRFTGEYRANGVESEKLELVPSETGQGVINQTFEFNVTLPTEMNNETWSDLLSNEMDEGLVNHVNSSSGNVTITMDGPNSNESDSPDQVIVRCTTIGIDEAPDVEPSNVGTVQAPPEEVINPVGRGIIQLTTVEEADDINATFWNREDGPRNLTEARILYTQGSGQNVGDTINLSTSSGEKSLVIGGEKKNVSSLNFHIPKGQNETLVLKNVPNTNSAGIGVKLTFEDPGPSDKNSTYSYFLSTDE